MELNARDVRNVLLDKGVIALYHANTLTTSCTFLRHGALLSRGFVTKQRLPQTPQDSDEVDRKYGIWNDIFLDAVDIHKQASKRNLYGPVLFVIDIDVLKSRLIKKVWITKKNPIYWKPKESKTNRYYTSVEEFQNFYIKGDFAAMIVLRDIDGIFPLEGTLKKIIVDDPRSRIKVGAERIKAFDFAAGALRAAAKVSGLKDLKIKRRACIESCRCRSEYKASRISPELFEELFVI